tara:strand:+ start:477 stop:962 length:486 start_codon:yes stop_codon:yes gene_type:complete
MAIELSDSVLTQILRQHIKENINMDHVIDLITSRLSDTDKGTLLEILLSQDEYHSIDQGDIVWLKINKYDDPKVYGCKQTLKDIGLIKDNYILGRIVDSDNYGTDFDKWHYKFQTEMIVIKDKKFTKAHGPVDRKDIKTINESSPNYKMRQIFLDKMEEID